MIAPAPPPPRAHRVVCRSNLSPTEGSYWRGRSEPLGRLVGHRARVARAAYHPCGQFIGTASFDTSWRLWDAVTCQELLLQEGHSKEVYALAFQRDGALAVTGYVIQAQGSPVCCRVIVGGGHGYSGLDACGILWDLRSGRKAMALEGHVKSVLALDFSPNGCVRPHDAGTAT
jgi:U4/U6 small nuclear ribonucleoprotein PRP4